MEQSIKDKIAKVYELVNRGATEGERSAAKKALDRILSKHKIHLDDPEAVESFLLDTYLFPYKSTMHMTLLGQIIKAMLESGVEIEKQIKRRPSQKMMVVKLKYLDAVVVECAYEYFRRHMDGQWKIYGLTRLSKCRKASTKIKLRKSLELPFLSAYLIKSGLVLDGDTTNRETTSGKSEQHWQDASTIEGGSYKTQIITTNLLEN